VLGAPGDDADPERRKVDPRALATVTAAAQVMTRM